MSRVRTRQASGEALHYWPRRSARLIGIPAEIDEQQNKSNGSIEEDAEDEEDHDEEPASVSESNDTMGAEDQCKDCKQRKTKQDRTLEALLIESERFMHYPSKGSGCRMGRSTYNSRDIRPPQTSPRIEPPPQTSPLVEPPPPPSILLPVVVDQVQFSFEIVPSGTTWYQTFLRDEAQGSQPLPDDPPSNPAPFLLPYEMSLEAILKSNRTVRKNNKGKAKGTKKAVPLSFRPIISTRLQMQSAARQSQLAAAAASTSSTEANGCNRHDRQQRKKPWFNMPRKSPRCHASTMAILCSKSDTEVDGKPTATSEPVPKSQPPEEIKEIPPPDGYLVQVLEGVLTQGMEKRPANQTVLRKRGRPRKRPLPPDEQSNSQLVESSLTELLATPLERIKDIVDERISPTNDICMFGDDDDLPIVYPANCWTANRQDRPLESSEVLHDLDSPHSGSRSSSVYETGSEIGSTSTSTGTCDSRRKAWRSGNRRKRRNMTGWPRSKRRRPAPLNLIDVDEDLNLTGDLSCNGEEEDDDAMPVLSPIREESILADGSDPRPQPQQRSSYVSKPFQFQRKTLRFVGKRILRPAAQRHAPQRLEYWPCFPTESTGKRRKRKTS